MARDGSGTYSLASGNPVTAGTSIDDAWANATMTDIETALTDSLSRSGNGAMTAPLKLPDGSVSAPSWSFSNESGSGMYSSATGEVSATILGVRTNIVTANIQTIVAAGAASTLGPILKLHRNSASPADADFIGAIYFDGEDDGDNQTTFASIEAQIDDVTNSTEDGTLLVKTMQAGTLTTVMDISTVIVITPNTTFSGTLTVDGLTTHGGNVVSDTDSTDSLGVTGTRWLKLWVDNITMGGTIAGAVMTLSTSITLATGATVTGIADEDDMTSASATLLATQQSIKAYVDAQTPGGETLAEVLGTGASSGGTDMVITAGDIITVDTINETTSAGGVTIDGALIKDGVFVGAGLTLKTEVTADGTTAVAGGEYPCDTSAGAFTITLPASPSVGDKVKLTDVNGTHDANNLTIGRNSKPVMRLAEDGTMNIKNAQVTWTYYDATNGWLPG